MSVNEHLNVNGFLFPVVSAGFLVFVNLYCVKYGAIALQEIFDDIQPK